MAELKPGQSITITCIGCPMGCQVTVSSEDGQTLTISGALCARGETYARAEITSPARDLTTLIVIPGIRTPLPVKTSRPIPRKDIPRCLARIHETVVQLPVQQGDIIIHDLFGTGCDIVATRSLDIPDKTGQSDEPRAKIEPGNSRPDTR